MDSITLALAKKYTDKQIEKAEMSDIQDTRFNSIVMVDEITGHAYVVTMRNGTLTSMSKCVRIEVTTLPNKTVYMEGDGIDLTGIVITAFCEDGSTFVVDNYTHSAGEIINDTICEIAYVAYGEEYTTSIEFTIVPFDPAVALMDFDYVAEPDGTYTITGWKSTFNGQSSTEIIIPNNRYINV